MFDYSKSYYKFLGRNLGSYPYKIGGLNILGDNGEEFDPLAYWVKGGLYFTDIKHIFEFINYGFTLCEISVPPDAQVVQVETSFKADKIVIERTIEWTTLEGFLRLLKMGADIHINQNFAAEWTAANGYTEVLSLLLQYMPDNWALYEACLSLAAKNGRSNVVQLLIDYGVNSNGAYSTALGCACANGKIGIARHLLQRGADPNALGGTLLKTAAERGYNKIYTLLLTNGADPTAMNFEAVRAAVRNNQVKLVNTIFKSATEPQLAMIGKIIPALVNSSAKRDYRSMTRLLLARAPPKYDAADVFRICVAYNHLDLLRDILQLRRPTDQVKKDMIQISIKLKNNEAISLLVDNDPSYKDYAYGITPQDLERIRTLIDCYNSI